MNLVEESFQNKEEKKTKNTLRIILVIIILLVIIIIGIIAYLSYIKSQELRVSLDNNIDSEIKDMLLYKNDKIYLPVKEFAKKIGYEYNNGEYREKSEVDTKCYVENNKEIANLSLGSNKITKLLKDDKDESYEVINAQEDVISNNSKLYISVDGLQKTFNVSFNIESENRINIYSLNYLIQGWKSKANEWGYEIEEDNFVNQKAILDNMLVVHRAGDEDDGKFGVIDVENNIVLDLKYDSITYIQNSKDFLVESDGKFGIISASNKKTKVKLIYDSIKLMDTTSGLYLVENDSKYGVIDTNGNIIIYVENEEIGIDISSFKENNIENKYILANKLIPVKKNELWALYNMNGKQLTDFSYETIGYIAANDKGAYNLVVIPEYNVVVAKKKDEKYVLINSSGKEVINAVADDIYMTIDGGEKSYWILVNDRKIDAIDYLKKQGITKNSSSENEENEESEDETTNNQISEEEENTANEDNNLDNSNIEDSESNEDADNEEDI